MEQEHRITYKAGITRTPSDFLCQDGELAECINLATDNEELKPIVQPAEHITSARRYESGQLISMDMPTFLYIHKYNDTERYVGHIANGNMVWGQKSGSVFIQHGILTLSDNQTPLTVDSNTKITSVGKTLVVQNDSGIHYFLWKRADYTNLGPIPEQEVEFWLTCEEDPPTASAMTGTRRKGVNNTGDGRGTLFPDKNNIAFTIDKQDEYNDIIVGLYSKNVKEISKQKKFCQPFYVRTALKMYDGTYTRISQPVLMFPCITENTFGTFSRIDGPDDRADIILHTNSAELHYKIQTGNYSEWNDIIKNITVFVSDGVDPHVTGIDQFPNVNNHEQAHAVTCETDGVFRKTNSATRSHYVHDTLDYGVRIDDSFWFVYHPLRKKEKADLINDLKGVSLFYRLCDIGIRQNTDTNIASCVESNTLEFITNQERLEVDDYFSRSTLYPTMVYSYNSRLNLANVRRSLFEGYDFFMPFDNVGDNHLYEFYVKIAVDLEDVWVKHETLTKQMQGCYFYYPDSRAKRVVIFKDNRCILDEELTEHNGLNGAYFFKGLPGTDYTGDEQTLIVPAEDPTSIYNNGYKEQLANYIITSEVNNPWVFNAEGYNKVSTGKIIGISTITQALSQGQFGQFPLLVFSENGIWAMSVDSTGLYQAIYPMSRDVCINPGSILQTDGAVFFVSKKGLMMIAGNDVRCVSEQMNGKTFNTSSLSPLATDTDWEDIVEACQDSHSFLDYMRDDDMFMAYDYIDSRILIINPDFDFAFVYNIADGTISKVIMPAAITNAVNNYPDYLIQGTTSDNKQRVYSFYEKPREEEVANRSLCFLLTRPMKLAGPVSQASLRQLMNVGTWDPGTTQTPLSCVKTEVYLSSDMLTWYNDVSRFGAAARYYRLALYVKMLPTERLSGTILSQQERRSHNMR